MAKRKQTSKELSEIIQRLHNSYQNLNSGKLASYIPELGKVDPKKFGISITTVDGETISTGDVDHKFTIQSISKPFVFGLAMEKHGLKKVRSRVGVEPTGEPFNSLIRLQAKSKRPANPLVNTGAIAMTNLVRGKSTEKGRSSLNQMFQDYAGRKLELNQEVYDSERMTGHRNRAMAYLMLHFGMVEPDIEEIVDLYFRQCSYDVDTKDLSMMAATLANKGVNPKTQVEAIDEDYLKHVLTLMFTCGLYTFAGEWAFHVGIPAKSGVCGGILGVVPGKMGISVYSPLIDRHGNSVRGVKVFRELAKELNLHVFKNSL